MVDKVRRWPASPLVAERYVRDVAVAPEALSRRLRDAVNNKPRRAFGVLKVSSEWLGVVTADEFVVWERQGHATRAIGRIKGRRGGSRVEARIGITRRTRVMTAVFLVLFVVAATLALSREGGLGIGPAGLAVAAAGALVTLALFWAASVSQRAALRAFLDGVLTVDR